jgi:hypothetical protein
VNGEEGQSVADAFSLALRTGVTRIADHVVAKLADRAPRATR